MKPKQPLKETFDRIGGKSSLNEKKDASWTWDELNDTLFNYMNMPPRKIADIRSALKRHTRK
jgi:hypothetical protein